MVPDGVQGYDRYACTSNNPLRYTDPTGHKNCEEDGYCPPSLLEQARRFLARLFGLDGKKPGWQPRGNQVQANIFGGVSVAAPGIDDQPTQVGLFYYAVSVVTDSSDNLQIYGTRRDITYVPGRGAYGGGYRSGTLESKRPSGGFGVAVSVISYGAIWGDDFTVEKYRGTATDYALNAGLVALDAYRPPDGSYLGVDVGLIGLGAAMSDVNTYFHPMFGKPVALSPEAIFICKLLAQCGNLPGGQYLR